MANSIISRYGLDVEIPGDVEAKGVDAVEAHAAAALDVQCRQTFRIPLAQLDGEVAAAIRAVTPPTDEERAVDPVGVATAHEAAVKAAVDGILARATTRATTLPAVAPAPAAADDEDEATR